jgi:hypothetical protein
MKSTCIILAVLGLSAVCFGYSSADLDSDGIVDFYDFAIFSEQWLKTVEDQNAANPKFKFGPYSAELSFARDSISYDHELNEYAVDAKRIEPVCIASRPAVFINKDVARVIYDVDGNEVLCGWGSSLYTTADGESFICILDIRSDTPLDSGGKFSDYTVSDEIVEGLTVMADGSWLLSTGRGLPGIRGHLFRSINKGASWSVCKWAVDGTDFQFGMGYTPEWGPVGIADNEVVVGEYGYYSQEDNPRRIYYSDDYGATWTMIIDIGSAGWTPGDVDGQHCHAVTFGIGDTNIIYAVWGDYIFDRFKKFICTGNKKNPSDWIEVDLPWKLFVYRTCPVCLFNDGSYIYVGRDGSGPTLWRFDANENRETVISFPTEPGSPTEGVPYRCPYSDATYVFRMIKHDGVFYPAVSAHSWQKRMAGIYVSTDGKHWVCARRFFGERGPYTIVGYANGYIWGTYKDDTNTLILFKFTPVNAKVVPALRVERGITNIANSANHSCFDTAVEDWTFSDNIDSVVWTDTEPLLGGGCVKVVSKDDAGDLGYVYTKKFADMGGLPSPGDYICFSLWVKAASSWPEQADFSVSYVNSTNIDYHGAQVQLNEEWQRVVIWGKCTGTPSSALKGKFRLDAKGYTGSFSDFEWYIDGLQVVYFPDLHYSGAWQKGGTARADELAVFPLIGLSHPFTLSLTWLPDCGSSEWHTDCPIATIVGLDGSYLELFWDQSENEFSITDGISTEIIDSNDMGVWEHPDMIKFAAICDGFETDLYIENSVNGIASVIGSNGCTLTDLPAYIILASNNDRTILGCGLFPTIRAWDLKLSQSDISEVFDSVN